MFIELQWIRFPIPFRNINFSQQQLIDRIDLSRRNGKLLIGEFKLSDRQVVILFSYLITTLIDSQNVFSKQPKLATGETKREDDTWRVVAYLCKSDQRKRELLQIATTVYTFVDKIIIEQRLKNQFHLQKQSVFQTKIHLKMCEGTAEEQRQCEDYIRFSKITPTQLKRFYIMPVKKYMDYKLKRKEEAFWKKCYEYDLQIDTKDNYSYIIRKVDMLMIEANDLEGIIQELLSVSLFELHLHRANIQYRKLDKFYSYRPEEIKKMKNNGALGSMTKLPSKKELDLQKDASVEKKDKSKFSLDRNKKDDKNDKNKSTIKSDKDKNAKQGKSQEKLDLIPAISIEDDKNSEIKAQRIINSQQNLDNISQEGRRTEEKKSNYWNIADYDRKFNDLYTQKKAMLQNVKVGYNNNDRLLQGYMECYYLMNLQTVGFLISCLIVEWSQSKFHETCDSSQTFINFIFSKTLLSLSCLRKLKRNFIVFVKKNPPILLSKELSYCYIEEVLNFFQKLVVWHQIFNHRPANLKQNPQPDNTSNRMYEHMPGLMIFREKVNKDSNLKLTTFDQRIFFDIITENTKTICIFQNFTYSYQYFETIFIKPQKSRIQFEYRCPKLMSDQQKYTLTGLIVTSTPNEEDLHIASEKMEDISKQLLEEKKEDKEHYCQIIRSYGVLIHDICEIVPDGVVVYFPSRDIMKECRAEWEMKENIYQRINKTKTIFEESEWQEENTRNITKFKKLCKIGRGSVFFVSAQSEFSKFETFYGFYSRCVVFVGVPFHNFHLQTEQKIKFLGLREHLKEHIRFEQGLKNVNRCLNNCVNDPDQIKTIVLADVFYNKESIKKKWFPFIEEGNLNTLQVLDLISAASKRTSSLIHKKREENLRKSKELNFRREDGSIDFTLRRQVSDGYEYKTYK